jgi:hypothetical protein
MCKGEIIVKETIYLSFFLFFLTRMGLVLSQLFQLALQMILNFQLDSIFEGTSLPRTHRFKIFGSKCSSVWALDNDYYGTRTSKTTQFVFLIKLGINRRNFHRL